MSGTLLYIRQSAATARAVASRAQQPMAAGSLVQASGDSGGCDRRAQAAADTNVYGSTLPRGSPVHAGVYKGCCPHGTCHREHSTRLPPDPPKPTNMIAKIGASLAACVLAFCGRDLYHLFKGMVHPFFSPLRDVPGPKRDGVFLGNFRALTDADPRTMYEKWVEEHGHVLVFKAILNVCRRGTAICLN
jgi:hypothetical protein